MHELRRRNGRIGLATLCIGVGQGQAALFTREPSDSRGTHAGRDRRRGPVGLLLAHLLHEQGIESVVLENRTEEYVIARVRAGVLEQGVVDVFRAAGLADASRAEGLVHHGIELRFQGRATGSR